MEEYWNYIVGALLALVFVWLAVRAYRKNKKQDK